MSCVAERALLLSSSGSICAGGAGRGDVTLALQGSRTGRCSGGARGAKHSWSPERQPPRLKGKGGAITTTRPIPPSCQSGCPHAHVGGPLLERCQRLRRFRTTRRPTPPTTPASLSSTLCSSRLGSATAFSQLASTAPLVYQSFRRHTLQRRPGWHVLRILPYYP